MKGVFTMSAVEKADNDEREPFVSSKAIVVVLHGLAHIVYYHGTQLGYWLTEIDSNASQLIHDPPQDGVFFVACHIDAWRDYYGDHDEELTIDEIRPITPEEWQAFVRDEYVCDEDELRAHNEWLLRVSKEEQSDGHSK